MSKSDIKIGDIVTGYHKGYWIVTKVTEHVVYYTRVDVSRKSNKSCGIGWCTKIDPEKLRDDLHKQADVLYESMKAAQEKLI